MTVRRRLGIAVAMALGATFLAASMLPLSVLRLEAFRHRIGGARGKLEALEKLDSVVSRQVLDTLFGHDRALENSRVRVRAALELLRSKALQEQEVLLKEEKHKKEKLLQQPLDFHATVTRLQKALEQYHELRGTEDRSAIEAKRAEIDRIYGEEFSNRVRTSIDDEWNKVTKVESLGKQNIELMLALTTLIVIISCVLVSGASVRIVRDISRSLRILQEGTQRIGTGDLETPIVLEGTDELAQLGRTINAMMIDLQEKTVSRDYLDSIVQVMNEALFVLNPDGTIRMGNEATCKLFGYTSTEITTRSAQDLIEGQDLRASFDAAGRIDAMEKTGRTARGEKIPILLSASTLKDDEGKPATRICVVRDMTERKKAEDALRRAHDELEERVEIRTSELKTANEYLERFHAILDATSDFVAIVSPDRRFVYLNEAARQAAGLSLDADVSAIPMHDIYPNQTLRLLNDEAFPAATAQEHWTKEGWFSGPDEGRIPTSMVIVAHRDEAGEVRFFAILARDITEPRRIAQHLASLNKELESFAYSVSHDLRQPLRTMDGFSQALLDKHQAQLDDKGRHYLNRIRAGVERAGQTIDGLLGLSRVTRTELHRSAIDLVPIIRSIEEELRSAHPERNVAFNVADTMPTQADPDLLRAVFANLLGNAWKFTSKQTAAQIEVGVESTDEGPVYCVKDNGAGFDMTYADQLFGAFQRLHSEDEFEGTGIGLATVQRIIRRHGGQIWAESEVDRGAAFYFTLS